MRTISHFINGQRLSRAGAVTSPVYDPNTGQVQAHLEHDDAAILAEAVAIAKSAQPAWAGLTCASRAIARVSEQIIRGSRGSTIVAERSPSVDISSVARAKCNAGRC